MPLNRRIGLGMTIAVDAAGGTSFTTLGAVVDGGQDSDAKKDVAALEILSDAVKLKAQGQVDPGEFSFTIAYDPDESSTTVLHALLLSTGATAPNWRITLPSGSEGAGTITSKTFRAFLTGMGRSMKKDSMMVCSITLTKTGATGF